MEANDQQKTVITTLDRPIQVSAGAGTGKTKTLSERLLYAFTPSEDKDAFLDEPKQIMAITFTKKAAAELAHRVRRGLKQNNLLDVSRKIDEAWIFTIDSMCSRILRENALYLQINPEFKVIEQNDYEQIIIDKLEKIIKLKKMEDNPVFDDLLYMYQLEDIYSDIKQLVNDIQIVLATSNKDSIDYGPQAISVKEALEKSTRVYLDLAEGLRIKKPEDASVYENQVEELQKLYANFTDFQSEYEKLKEISVILNQVYPGRRGKIKDLADEVYAVILEVEAALLKEQAKYLLDIAFELNKQMWDYAHEHNLYSFNQIEVLAYRCLKNKPELTQEYKDQFKIIMVDEFQDTNQLQVEIVKLLSKEGLVNLCTVGDAQQAIYEFRGAEVEVYLNHKEEMAKRDALITNLQYNYRSNKTILDTVEDIFHQPEVFGKDFLQLIAGRDESKVKITFDQQEKRVTIIDKASLLKGEKVSQDDIAENIARTLADMRDKEGVSPGDICLLLEAVKGKDTHYIDALNRHGFEVVVHGGSAFFQSEEIELCLQLLAWVYNPQDDISLVNILLSSALSVDESELLEASLSSQDYKQSLYHRLKHSMEDASHLKVYDAVKILLNFKKACETLSFTQAFHYFIEASGYDLKLLSHGAQGKAQYANILKFIDMLKQEELHAYVEPSKMYKRMHDLALNPEAPAALDSKDAIHLMTIHASKGLQFPLVAVGAINNLVRYTSSIASLYRNEGGQAAFMSGKRFNQLTNLCNSEKSLNTLADNLDPLDRTSYASAIVKYSLEQSEKTLQEKYRKYYVALTRAEDALVLASTKGLAGTNAMGFRNMLISGLVDESKNPKIENLSEKQILESKSGVKFTYIPLDIHLLDDEISQDQSSQELYSFNSQRGYQWLRSKPQVSFMGKNKFSFTRVSSPLNSEEPHSDSAEFIDSQDLDKKAFEATSFGVAMHALLEHIVLYKDEYLKDPETFIQKQIHLLSYGHEDAFEKRLNNTFNSFKKSGHLEHILDSKYAHPELEFNFSISKDTSSECQDFMGFIDLVLHQSNNQAEIIDYKTGYKNLSVQSAQEKFLLQAQVYAYALLEAGFKDLEVNFIRLEADDTISYHFSATQKDELYASIQEAFTAHLLEEEMLQSKD